MSNTFGIDLGTCNVKVFCKATGKVLNEKNTIAIVNKNQMYAYGDQAYAMYEKAPENINVTFPVINGVIADYANMQTMIFEFLEKYSKGKVRGAEFVVAVPTDITEVEKKAFFDIFAKSKVNQKACFSVRNHLQMPLDWELMSTSRPVSWLWISEQIQQRFPSCH